MKTAGNTVNEIVPRNAVYGWPARCLSKPTTKV